ncbi:bacteriocin [Lactobacillus sp. DCY120]|uniref:Bacteriocin n=1 Tax=Bombilactobacillus apium TaxID=2675299 RepID=A0A850R2G9_9LACO|nr:bacteriocin [Bombilactobacillus apium]NVY96540.1 bacteriocin [Bombilactobacillus apium]
MSSLEQISKLNNEVSEQTLASVSGGRGYSNKWWYKFLNGMGQVAEAGSGLWHIRY